MKVNILHPAWQLWYCVLQIGGIDVVYGPIGKWFDFWSAGVQLDSKQGNSTYAGGGVDLLSRRLLGSLLVAAFLLLPAIDLRLNLEDSERGICMGEMTLDQKNRVSSEKPFFEPGFADCLEVATAYNGRSRQ